MLQCSYDHSVSWFSSLSYGWSYDPILSIKPKCTSACRVSWEAFAILMKRWNVCSCFDFRYICCWSNLMPNKTKLSHFYFKIIANAYKELNICQTAYCVLYLNFISCNLNNQTVDINIIYVCIWRHWSTARKMNFSVVIKLVKKAGTGPQDCLTSMILSYVLYYNVSLYLCRKMPIAQKADEVTKTSSNCGLYFCWHFSFM